MEQPNQGFFTSIPHSYSKIIDGVAKILFFLQSGLAKACIFIMIESFLSPYTQVEKLSCG